MSAVATAKKKKVVWKGALWKAAAKGDLKALKKAIEKGDHPVNEFDDAWRSPLHYAAEGGSVEALEMLLAAGAKVDGVLRFGDPTPLHVALLARREDAAIFLARHGADASRETPQRQSGHALAAAIGKRFELRFKEALKPVSFLMPTGGGSSSATASASASAAAAPVPASAPEPVPAPPPPPPEPQGDPTAPRTLAGATVADFVRQQQQLQAAETCDIDLSPQQQSKPPAQQQQQPSAAGDPTAKRKLPKEKLDRAAALRRRIARTENVLKALQPWPEPSKATASAAAATKILRAAVASASSQAEPASSPRAVDTSAVAPQAQAERSTPRAPGAPVPAEESAPGSDRSDVRCMEAAVLMVQHLRSWFEPNVPPVLLPEWSLPDVKPAQTAVAAQPQQQQQQQGTASAQVAGDRATSSVPFVPLTRIVLKWCTKLCQLTIDTKDFDVFSFKNPAVKKTMNDLRELFSDLNLQVDAQAPSLGDAYPNVRDNVDTLRLRLDNLFDAYNSVLLANAETTTFVVALMQAIGATQWTFISMSGFTRKALVAHIKEFVSSLMTLGTTANSDIHTVVACLRLVTLVNGMIFTIQGPAVSKQLADHCSAVMLTARALVMTIMQGGQKSNEFNMIIGSHLGKIRDIVSTTVISRTGPNLPSRDEAAMANSGVRLALEALGYYEAQITHAALKDVLLSLQPLPKLISEFAGWCARARDTTLSTWVPVMKSALDLAASFTQFIDGSLKSSSDSDPDGVFDACAKSCEQLIVQMMIGIAAFSVENKVCPRHQLPIATRSLAFTLVAIMDLCYLNS